MRVSTAGSTRWRARPSAPPSLSTSRNASLALATSFIARSSTAGSIGPSISKVMPML
nr:hypothetical protein [Burkholderia gladioli]